jgi:hypothetical protein
MTRYTEAIRAVLALLVQLGAYAGLSIRRGFSTRGSPSGLGVWIAKGARKLSGRPIRPRCPKSIRDKSRDICETPVFAMQIMRVRILRWDAISIPRAPDMPLSGMQNMADGEIHFVIHNGVRLSGMSAWGSDTHNDQDSRKLVFLSGTFDN